MENRTDRIPEEVISPLLAWALRWINDFSSDVFSARDEWRKLYTARHATKRPNPTDEKMPAKLAALQGLLDDYRKGPGLERWFIELAGLVTQAVPDIDAIVASARRHGTELDLDSLPDLLSKHGLRLPGL